MNKRKIFSLGRRFAGAFPTKKLRTVRPMFFYMLAYLVSFGLIEQWNRLHYTVIHTVVDDMIPFSPVFVIPYILWFPYVLCFTVFLLMKNEEAYHRLCTVLSIGMTIFIVVSVVFPNIHLLRPETMPPEKHSDKFVTLSLADAIGDVIMRIQGRRSVSQLFLDGLNACSLSAGEPV